MIRAQKRKTKPEQSKATEMTLPPPVPLIPRVGMHAAIQTDDGMVTGPIISAARDHCVIRLMSGDDDRALKKAGGNRAAYASPWPLVYLLPDLPGDSRDPEPNSDQWWYLYNWASFLETVTGHRTLHPVIKRVNGILRKAVHAGQDMNIGEEPAAAELRRGIDAFYKVSDEIQRLIMDDWNMGEWDDYEGAKGLSCQARPVLEIDIGERWSNGAADAHHGIAFSDDTGKDVVLQVTMGTSKNKVRDALLNALDLIDKQWKTLIEDPMLAWDGQLPTVAQLCRKGEA